MDLRTRLLGVLVALLTVAPSFGQGVIIVDRIMPPHPDIMPPPVPPRTWPLKVVSEKVNIEVRDFASTVTLEQSFRNQYPSRIEGTFLFPLPEGASVTDFAMTVNGEMVGAELLDAGKARSVYEEIVRRQRDPGLLEYLDRATFKARIFPIEPGETKRVKLEYTHSLTAEDGLARLVFPLKTRAWQQNPAPWPVPMPMVRDGAVRPISGDDDPPNAISSLVISVRIESKVGIKSVYSPTHELDLHRDGDHVARAGYESTKEMPLDDFVLYYQLSDANFGLSMLPFRSPDDELGTFMMLIAPKTDIREQEIAAKDIVFILDTSGSMSGAKMDQAKAALRYCLRNLKENDRFNVLAFSTAVDSFENGLLKADKANIDKAVEFVDKLAARSGTNIAEALDSGLTKLPAAKDKARPAMVVFLTDGQPTVGETRIERILETAGKRNGADARLFVFGVGDDVNTELLDRLSTDNHGTRCYVRPSENIEVPVSSFYNKVACPVLSDLKLEVDGVKVEDLQPVRIGDLFRGSQLTLLGRYRGTGAAKVTLRGTSTSGDQSFAYNVDFPARERANSFVPRLWATRKVGYLLEQIRLNGQSKEVVDEIVRLATRYGIMTPYTSFLVLEPGMKADTAASAAMRAPGGPMMPGMMPGGGGFGGGMGGMGGRTDGFAGPPRPTTLGSQVGKEAVDRTVHDQRLQEANQAGRGNAMQQQVGARTFYQLADYWTDSTYPADESKLTKLHLQWGSEAFFELVRLRADLKDVLAVGDKLKVQIGQVLLVIDDAGDTKLNDTQRAQLKL
ncbi:MAG: VWA domain-containing protein [Armatimonadetes bacterium]|nr:VWA domain-containing protein [Armatimonadota bacterium]